MWFPGSDACRTWCCRARMACCRCCGNFALIRRLWEARTTPPIVHKLVNNYIWNVNSCRSLSRELPFAITPLKTDVEDYTPQHLPLYSYLSLLQNRFLAKAPKSTSNRCRQCDRRSSSLISYWSFIIIIISSINRRKEYIKLCFSSLN